MIRTNEASKLIKEDIASFRRFVEANQRAEGLNPTNPPGDMELSSGLTTEEVGHEMCNRVKDGTIGRQGCGVQHCPDHAENAQVENSSNRVQQFVDGIDPELVERVLTETSAHARRSDEQSGDAETNKKRDYRVLQYVDDISARLGDQKPAKKAVEDYQILEYLDGMQGRILDDQGAEGQSAAAVAAALENLSSFPRPEPQALSIPGAHASGAFDPDCRTSPVIDVDWEYDGDHAIQGSAVEARAVPDDESDPDMAEATPVDPNKAAQRAAKRSRELWVRLAGIFVITCVIIGIVLLVVLVLSGGRNSGEVMPHPNVRTITPTPAPSANPSAAPSSVLDTFIRGLPNSTLTSLEDPFSVQHHAYQWLLTHQDLSVMDDSRKKQLFSLATFYYAFEGPNWPQFARDDWLDDNTHECNWFSNEYGYFDKNGSYHELHELIVIRNYGVAVCNEKGEYQSIVLEFLELDGLKPFIPPEISLLSSLLVLAYGENIIEGSLQDMLPTEIYQMTNLQVLDFYNNSLTGMIPSELGLLSNLDRLYFDSNLLSGSIPTDLGGLTRLTDVTFYDNILTGTIPSELGLLTLLEYVSFDINLLEGSIPSQLGQLTNAFRFWANNNSLTGTIPSELDQLAVYNVTNVVSLEHNLLSGTISNALCSLGKLEWDYFNFFGDTANGLSFDCNENLCGCTWCPCFSRNQSAANVTKDDNKNS